MIPSKTLVLTTTAATPIQGAFLIEMLTDTVFAALDGQVSGHVGPTFKEARQLYVNGPTSVTLASGSIVIYFR